TCSSAPMRASRSRPIKRRPLFARPGLSPATKPACGLKGPTLIIGFSTARMRWCISPIIHAAPVIVNEMMGGHAPNVWISDRYAGQQKHGARHQTCLAHLARDKAFALEHGFDDLPLRFKLWFGKAFDLARDIANFAASTIVSKKRALERQLTALLAVTTGCDLARKLQA